MRYLQVLGVVVAVVGLLLTDYPGNTAVRIVGFTMLMVGIWSIIRSRQEG